MNIANIIGLAKGFSPGPLLLKGVLLIGLAAGFYFGVWKPFTGHYEKIGYDKGVTDEKSNSETIQAGLQKQIDTLVQQQALDKQARFEEAQALQTQMTQQAALFQRKIAQSQQQMQQTVTAYQKDALVVAQARAKGLTDAEIRLLLSDKKAVNINPGVLSDLAVNAINNDALVEVTP